MLKLKSLTVAAIVAISYLSLVPSVVRADDCRSSVSLIQLPSGKCIDLTHLTKLGASRAGVAISQQQLERAIRLNQQNNISVTDTIGVGDTFVSTTTTNRENPTASLQKAREGLLSDTASGYRESLSANQPVEDYAFKRQLRVMNQVSGVFARPLH